MSAFVTTCAILGAFVLGMYVGIRYGVRVTMVRFGKADQDGTIRIARKVLQEWERE